MIMPRGEQLLLPASPWFIGLSLFLALVVNLLPTSNWIWMPDLLLLVLVTALELWMTRHDALEAANAAYDRSLVGAPIMVFFARMPFARTTRSRMIAA